jgi:hypothetical protein
VDALLWTRLDDNHGEVIGLDVGTELLHAGENDADYLICRKVLASLQLMNLDGLPRILVRCERPR